MQKRHVACCLPVLITTIRTTGTGAFVFYTCKYLSPVLDFTQVRQTHRFKRTLQSTIHLASQTDLYPSVSLHTISHESWGPQASGSGLWVLRGTCGRRMTI
ncbi:hypothetical protein F4604DRAFT_1821973 [Suillus subluteus]|nr:hypothetical protein F4604DRAFT_1821973 [Suillus subluteus]